LEVSAATSVRWAQRWRAAGSLAPGKVGGHRRPILDSEREWLLARHARKKDITLHALLAELAAERGVIVSCDTLWRFLRANGITFKKRRSIPRSRTGPTLPADASAGGRSSSG
jgi:transposase